MFKRDYNITLPTHLKSVLKDTATCIINYSASYQIACIISYWASTL